uniref:C2 tensin-type domain-containing protein n=1 Tax=Pinguiococcus pyrenoidosus TaxID=172671 RepID=A0A7R9YEV9_9STRA
MSPMGPPGTQEGRSWKEKTVWSQWAATGSTIQAESKDTEEIVLDLADYDIQIHGNIKVAIFERDRMRNKKIGAVWFHTAFVETNYLKFDRSQIDKLCKAPDTNVPKDFTIELFLHRVADDKDFRERMSMVAVDQPEHDIEEDHIELAEDLDEELRSAGIAVHELTSETLSELERRLSIKGMPMGDQE